MGIMGRHRLGATGRSTISRGMRLGTGKGMWAKPDIAPPMNTALELSVEAAAVVGAEAGGTNSGRSVVRRWEGGVRIANRSLPFFNTIWDGADHCGQ
jgi:hypothetical protein